MIFFLCVGKALGCCFGSSVCRCGSGHVPVRVGAKGMTRKPAEGLACDRCAWVKSVSLFLVFLITPLRRNSLDELVMMKLIIVRHNKDEMVLLMIQQEDL